MQLDDDSLFAIYYKYDPHGTGKVPYHLIMKELVRARRCWASRPCSSMIIYLHTCT